MTPEGKVKRAVKNILNENNVYFFMPVQNGMGTPGLDFFCCCKGHFLAIETKAPGKKPTPRQHLTMLEIQNNYGKTMVIDGSLESLTGLQEWIDSLLE